jgi:phage tail sheath gpL-like
MYVPTNPDLPTSWDIPGVYFSLNLTGQGTSQTAQNMRLLCYGDRLSSGSVAADTPVRVTGQSDANSYFGRGSDLARIYAAALSQVGQGVLDVWCCGVNEPAAGTAATHLINVVGTSASTAGSVDIWIAGYHTSVGISIGDLAATVATNISAAINLLLDAPATASPSTASVVITARHKGVLGNDLPIRVDQSGATGLTFSPGILTMSGTTSGAGSHVLTVSSTAITTTLTNLDAAATVATNVTNSINGGGYPVTASVNSAVVTLLYASGRYVHKISTQIITSTGISSTPTVGTAGAGTPVLTTSLTNISALPAFGNAALGWNDTTSLGTISTVVEVLGNGLNQKGMLIHAGSTDALATAGAIPTGTTPLLTASPRYSVVWCPECPQQAYELAARAAAMVAAQPYAPKNYDGMPFATAGTVPLLVPPVAIQAPLSDLNSAIHTYYLTPIAVSQSLGQLAVVSGKTTSSSADLTLHDWGTIRHLDYLRIAFNARLGALFSGVSIRRNGVPHTANTVTLTSIVDAAFVLAQQLDETDLFDGAAQFQSAFQANFDPVVPTRVDCFIPLAVIRSLHQLGIVGAPV